MSTHSSVLRVLWFAAVVSTAACSGQSPVSPAATMGSASTTDATASRPGGGGSGGATPGIYEMGFLKEVRGVWGLQPVVDNTLNVGESLVLTAMVTDASGALAQDGRITFEYCDLSNVKVPSSECATGRGRWKRYWSGDVHPVVGARVFFGSCSTPRVIGFRFHYSGGSTIAAGVSAPKDATWQ
jgi:hypothetical protein